MAGKYVVVPVTSGMRTPVLADTAPNRIKGPNGRLTSAGRVAVAKIFELFDQVAGLCLFDLLLPPPTPSMPP